MIILCCSRVTTLLFSTFLLISLFGHNNNGTVAGVQIPSLFATNNGTAAGGVGIPSLTAANDTTIKHKKAAHSPYMKGCTMTNLLVSTRHVINRFAYGLTLDCTLFFFEMQEYRAFEMALDFLESQYDFGNPNMQTPLCPVDQFMVQYVPQNNTPYLKVLELQTGKSHYFPVPDKSIYFAHFYHKTDMTFRGQFSTNGWANIYDNIIVHGRPRKNPKNGRAELRTYIRYDNEEHPGGCIRQSFRMYHLFQFYPLLGYEADDLKAFFVHGTPIPHRHEEEPENFTIIYYLYSIIGVIAVALLVIFVGIGISIWRIITYYSLEEQRSEIEKFVVACYVEKLEKLSKGTKGYEKPEKKKKKKKKSTTESESSHRHHRRRRHRRRSFSESVSKIPHGSKLIPIPNEKDLFASDKKKAELKPAAVQEPKKGNTVRRDPSKGSNASVCSLRSITQSVDDSYDWTGKGVRVSQRKTALELLKEEKEKDEEEAYKLGMNLSTFKRKKKRQQHGISLDDEESKKENKTQYPLSHASGMSSYTKPPPPSAAAAPSKTPAAKATATIAPKSITAPLTPAATTTNALATASTVPSTATTAPSQTLAPPSTAPSAPASLAQSTVLASIAPNTVPVPPAATTGTNPSNLKSKEKH